MNQEDHFMERNTGLAFFGAFPLLLVGVVVATALTAFPVDFARSEPMLCVLVTEAMLLLVPADLIGTLRAELVLGESAPNPHGKLILRVLDVHSEADIVF